MAVELLTNFDDALSQLFAAMLARQTNRQAVLIGLLDKMSGRGKNCAWDVTFNNMTGDSTYTEGAAVVTATDLSADQEEDAILPWDERRRNFGISSKSKAAAASSIGNATEYTDMIMKLATDNGARLLSDMNIAAFVGGGSLVGLQAALATTGTYATIDKAVETEWQGNVDTNSGTPRALSKGLLDGLDNQIFTASGRTANCIVTTPGVATKYENLLDAISRVLVERGELAPNTGVVGTPIAGRESGFTGLHYKGTPIYRDKDCPSGHLFMLSLDSIEFVTLAQTASGQTAMSFVERMLSDEQGREAGVLDVRMSSLAKEGSSDRFMIELFPVLKVKHPNQNGFIDDIQE